MPYRKREFKIGGYYHVFNRGVNRADIFYSYENYIYCLNLIKKYSRLYSISTIAYCLMPNHYHILLRQDTEIPIWKFINVIFNSYVQGFNKEQDRKGPLFEGRFKHILIDRHEYLLHLCRYIHLNPVNAALVDDLEKWQYSNYLDWVGKRKGMLIDIEFVKSYFSHRKDYEEFVADYQMSKELNKEVERYLLG